MRSQRGYTLIEILVAVGFIGVVSAIALPVFSSASALNNLWTSSERIGALVRQTRLKALSQNRTYVIRFSCPVAGQMRALIVTGTPAIDNDPNRCTLFQAGDSEVVQMQPGVAFAPAAATALQVTGRGVFSAVGDVIPLTIDVTYGSSARYVTVGLTGQVTFSYTDPTVEEDE